MLYDEIQSTIEPVASPSSAPAIFVEAPNLKDLTPKIEQILPVEPTASNDILQHNQENLFLNDEILQHVSEKVPENEIRLQSDLKNIKLAKKSYFYNVL